MAVRNASPEVIRLSNDRPSLKLSMCKNVGTSSTATKLQHGVTKGDDVKVQDYNDAYMTRT